MSTRNRVSPAVALYARATARFDRLLRQVGPHQWSLPTPCPSWDVRDLVHHIVAEVRWAPPLLDGRTIAEVGTALSGDLLGADPLAAWDHASRAAAVAAESGADGRTVHLSFGDVPSSEYLWQLTADLLLHAWDLAVAIGADEHLDPVLVEAVGGWFLPNEAAYRAAGAVGPRPAVEHDADPQTRLLAMFGREAVPASLAAVRRFDAAFARQDVDAVMAAMTDDCAFESTAPPVGRRYEGQRDVRAAWVEFFASSSGATFETEEQFACGDRVVVRWHYRWEGGGHVRGVDVFRTRGGLVSEKLAYVKG